MANVLSLQKENILNANLNTEIGFVKEINVPKNLFQI